MTNTNAARTFAALAVGAGLLTAGQTLAQDEHVVVPQGDLDYSAGPPSLPEGAEFAVLWGDPGAAAPFALRLKFPDGYLIPPHSHPRNEVVTVISGTFELGDGEDADRKAAEALPAGSFFAFPPGMVHYAYADGETVVQLNSIGPWDIHYVDPADDPRQQ